ncbi:MAG: hypothetical protein IT200_17090 [Thermoleophilia bacterium]|nr:hypothetical protein [Thermoleophilia bacterium]
MEQYSLTQILLNRLMEETGLVPQGDLVERMARTPPAILRGMRGSDAETVGLAATLPLDLAPAVTELLTEGVGEDGRFDRAKADAYLQAQSQREDDDAEDDPTPKLVALAHEALGVDGDCAVCTEWLAMKAEEDAADEADEHGHHDPEQLLPALLERHPEQGDAWEPQMALRIARDAGSLFGRAAGFGALHEVVAHGGGAPGLSREGLAEAHGIQHVGMGVCEDAAQVHAFRVIMRVFKDTDGVIAGITTAEQAAVQDVVGLAGIPAAIGVGLVAQIAEGALRSVPTPPPTRRLPKKKKR